MSVPTPSLYRGSRKTLVLSFDIGTTFSGVSYAILDPGEAPKIRPVMRYPGIENKPNDYRVPSIVCYRSNGIVHACGAEAEALEEEVDNAFDFVDVGGDDASVDDLVFVRRFKLHLRPDTVGAPDVIKKDLPPLPHGKSVVQVFADFLGYMFKCTRKYISESVPNGETFWNRVEDEITFILAHPNGWEGPQQNKMREAAILAGLVPETDAGRNRVHFVTEGEASVHYCVQHGLIGGSEEDGRASGSVTIIDAGGGTVDLSSYTFASTVPLTASEAAPPGCILEGSAIVTKRAEQFLKERFKGTDYGKEREMRKMVQDFDTNLKTLFKASHTKLVRINHHVHSRDDARLRLKRGYPVLTAEEMESFFRPALGGIVAEVRTQFQKATSHISSAFLLGGFSSNDWLFENLKKALAEQFSMPLSRPSFFRSKEVADGGVAFYLERFVSHRVLKYTYGTDVAIPFLPFLPEHKERADLVKMGPQGPMLIDAFSVILKKGSQVKDDEEFSEAYARIVQDPDSNNVLHDFSTDVICYIGPENTIPRWVDLSSARFKRVCVIRADLSKVTVQKRDGIVPFYVKKFDIVLLCGPELRAQVRWEENGEPKRGSAQIVYDE